MCGCHDTRPRNENKYECTDCGNVLPEGEICECRNKEVKVLSINHMSAKKREEISRLILENTVSY